MEKPLTKTRNYSIEIFRYICAVMVVAIHTQPTFADGNIPALIARTIQRLSVPFFFAVAGYFYIQKLEKREKCFLSYFKKLILTYTLWSIFYYVVEFASWGYTTPKGFLVNCVYSFVFGGTYYHFWFFPALIFAVCASTLVFKVNLSKLLIPGSILLFVFSSIIGATIAKRSWAIGGINIPLGKVHELAMPLLQGLFYFVCGYLVHRIKSCVGSINKKMMLGLLLVCFVFWVGFVCLNQIYAWNGELAIVIGLYCMTGLLLLNLLEYPLSGCGAAAKVCKYLSNFTYYSHPLFILFLNFVFRGILPCLEYLLFFQTVAATALIGLILYKLNNKYVNIFVQ